MKNDELSKFESGEESAISLSATIDLNIIDKDGNNCLHIAIKNGWTEVVRALLARGADVNKPGNNGQAPLEIAIYCQYLTFDDKRKTALREISKLLISKGAKTNIKTSDTGYPTFLFYAVGAQDTEMMQSLINQNKDLKVKKKVQVKDKDGQEKEEEQDVPYLKLTNNRGKNILLFAVTNEKDPKNPALELLLNQQEIVQNINAQDLYGNTALHLATENRNVDRVRLLVEKGGDIHAVNKEGNTPLHLAMERGNIELVTLLIEKGANINAVNKEGNTPLHIAISGGKIEVAKFLLEQPGLDINMPGKGGATPLQMAILSQAFSNKEKQERREISESLIKKGANINPVAINPDYPTLLFYAVRDNDEEMTKLLIDNKVDLKATNKNKKNILLYAIHENRILNSLTEIFKLLLVQPDLVKNINDPIEDGQTILHIIVNSIGVEAEMIEFLLDKGANINAVDTKGNTPLHLARSKEIAELLIRKGAEITKINNDGQTILHTATNSNLIEFLIDQKGLDINAVDKKGLDINAVDKKGNTPLHLAKSRDIAELLIGKGANIATKNNDGQTILHTVINQKNRDVDLIEFLVEKKELDINAVDKNGNTPLHLANSEYIAKFLIGKGTDITKINNDGQTILHIAVDQKYLDVELIEFLVEKGLDINAVDKSGKTALDYALEQKDSDYIQYVIDFLRGKVSKPAPIKKDNDNNIGKADDTRQNTQKNEQQKPKDNNGGKKDNDNIIDKTGDTRPNTQKNEQPEAKDKDGGKKDNSKRSFFIIAIGVILAAILGWMSYLKWDSIKNIFSSLAGKKSNISKGNSRLSPDSTYSPSRGSKISGRE